MNKMRWELRDIILMAVLGTLFAAVYLGVFYGGLGLQTALAPFGLAPFGFEVVYGVWFMAATIAAYIIQRPGAALITEVLAAAIELLMGNAGGAVLLLTGFIQGAGCELGFAVFRYRRFDLVSMALSGIFGATFIFAFELYYLQYILLSPLLLAAQLLVRYGSAVLFSGILAKRLCDGLVATGVLKGFPLGARQEPVVVLSD